MLKRIFLLFLLLSAAINCVNSEGSGDPTDDMMGAWLLEVMLISNDSGQTYIPDEFEQNIIQNFYSLDSGKTFNYSPTMQECVDTLSFYYELTDTSLFTFSINDTLVEEMEYTWQINGNYLTLDGDFGLEFMFRMEYIRYTGTIPHPDWPDTICEY